MDDSFDSAVKPKAETESTADNESTEPNRPIWLREQYSTLDSDLDLIDNTVVIPSKLGSAIDFLNYRKDWYISIDSNDGTTTIYDKKEIKTRLRTNIIAGAHVKNSTAIIFTKRKSELSEENDKLDSNNKWNQKTITLAEFVKKHFSLCFLYEPIWSHAKVGLILGAVIGIIFINTHYYTHLFESHLSLTIIPSFLPVNLISICLVCLLGMSVGGLIGWGRRRFMPRAHDAVSESNNIIIAAVLIPFMTVLGFIFAYLAAIVVLVVNLINNYIIEVINMM